MNGDLDLAWHLIQYLVIIGFSIAILFGVVFGIVRFAMTYALPVFVIAALIWFFGSL